MKVLVVGGGGRCHAIVHALSKSNQVTKLFCAPGNDGMKDLANLVNINDTNITELLKFALENKIDLTVVGPEVSLAAGIVDLFEENKLRIFGPTKKAAMIESSKEFAKDLMKKYNIPTADYEVFSDYDKAMEYVKNNKLPIVLKYDGLAAGKGVVVAQTIKEVEETLKDMLIDDKFGKASVVIEECLEGPEFSFMCFVSNDIVMPMPIAQDHKRAFDGDLGPNTGGMGVYSPIPFITKEDIDYSLEHIIKKTANALIKEGCPFKGILYGGLMKTSSGIKVIEFNARFGDPETEIILPKLKTDIVNIFNAVIDNKCIDIEYKESYNVGIVLASNGYPGDYTKGSIIKGLEKVDGQIYHMGTKFVDNNYQTNGGRVLIVVCEGKNIKEAQTKCLQEIKKIECNNLFYRKDIGHKAI